MPNIEPDFLKRYLEEKYLLDNPNNPPPVYGVSNPINSYETDVSSAGPARGLTSSAPLPLPQQQSPQLKTKIDPFQDFIAAGMYDSPEGTYRAQEAANRSQLMADIGAGLNTISRAAGAQNLTDDVYKNMAAQGQQGIGQETLRQKTIRDYLKDKADIGLKKQSHELQLEQLKNSLEQQKFTRDIETKKLNMELNKGTPAQQAADKKKAEEAADWDVSGRASYNNSVTRLDGVLGKLSTMKDSASNRIRGRFGDMALSDEQRNIKQDILNAALPIMKIYLPGTMSDNDVKKMIESYIDFSLSPEQNAQNIKQKMGEAALAAKSREQNASKYGLGGELKESVYSGGSDGGKIEVTNGKETLRISPSDLADAENDGYHKVQK